MLDFTPKAMVIHGVECDLLSFISDKFTWKYYYSNDLKVNLDHFKHYRSTFWNEAMEILGMLPMRFEGKIPGSNIYLEVEEILPQPLDDSIFEIPKIL